jgi:hypothetical protein
VAFLTNSAELADVPPSWDCPFLCEWSFMCPAGHVCDGMLKVGLLRASLFLCVYVFVQRLLNGLEPSPSEPTLKHSSLQLFSSLKLAGTTCTLCAFTCTLRALLSASATYFCMPCLCHAMPCALTCTLLVCEHHLFLRACAMP